MATNPYQNNGGPRPKTRPDDRRGAILGGTQQAFQPTPDQRAQVRAMAKSVTPKGTLGLQYIATHLGVSLATLQRHFKDDIDQGRAELQITCGAIMVRAATDGKYAQTLPKEQMDALRFVLTRLGGWSSKVEISGPGGGPVPVASFDFSAFLIGKTEDELTALLPALDAIISAAGVGGPVDDTGGGGSFEGTDQEDDS